MLLAGSTHGFGPGGASPCSRCGIWTCLRKRLRGGRWIVLCSRCHEGDR